MIYTTALPDDKTSIRLLTIKANPNGAARIETTLQRGSTHGPPYEALSHCWGTAPASITIGVGGKSIQVRPTLAEALHALRRKDEDRVVWVDALSINQEDVTEKSFQVSLMPDMYTNCSRVIIWIGQSDKDSRRTFSSIRKDGSKYPDRLTKVLRRPWFRRVWVVQEVALAPLAHVKCGDDEMHWDDFCQPILKMRTIRKILYLSRGKGEPYLHPAYYAQVMQEVRQYIQTGCRFAILEALRLLRPFNSTLRADKVYGVIGLLKNPESIKVDYIASAAESYARIALADMRASKSLDVLLDCTQHENGSSLAGLPSWAPDWSDIVAFQANSPDVEALRYQASQGSKVDADDAVEVNGVLQLSGLVIGSIEEIGKAYPSFDELREQYWPYGKLLPRMNALRVLNIISMYFRNSKRIAWNVHRASGSPKDRYITNETLQEAFYNAVDVNSPFSDAREAQTQDLRNLLFEFSIRQMERFSSSFLAHLPWPLSVIFLGQFFAISALIFTFKLPSSSRKLIAGSGQPAETTQNDIFGRSVVVGRTSNGYLGLFPGPFLTSPETLLTRVGDEVVLFKGSALPFVVRKVGKWHRLVGQAYVYAIMYGGAFEEEKCEKVYLV